MKELEKKIVKIIQECKERKDKQDREKRKSKSYLHLGILVARSKE